MIYGTESKARHSTEAANQIDDYLKTLTLHRIREIYNREAENAAELFQIWLNLPKINKMAEPHFKMLWREDIPVFSEYDENGNVIEVKIIAGELYDTKAPAPAPDSWAADEKNEVGIWLISAGPGCRWKIPAASPEVSRSIYYYSGDSMRLDSIDIPLYNCARINAASEVLLENGNSESHLLLLQGRPIAEPVAQYGPFVMNSQEEILNAFRDFQSTNFGGWPWPRPDNIHPRTKGRFALHIDGREEIK